MRDLLVLAAIGAAITLLFANGALDLATARLFYTPSEDHWPFGGEMPWSLLYKMAPRITASLVLGAMGALLVGFVRKRDEWRRDATFVLLALVLVDDGETVSVAGELHGFGLPTLRYAIEQHGWFTDLDASVKVRLPAAGLQQVVVQLARGNVKVTDATRAQLVASGAVRLDLRIASSDPLKRHAAAR